MCQLCHQICTFVRSVDFAFELFIALVIPVLHIHHTERENTFKMYLTVNTIEKRP